MHKVGLLFGSFNPVHIGHLMIANYFYAQTDLQEIWMVVTPQSPWKQNAELAGDEKRLKMIEISIQGTDWLKASLFEKELEQPNFTYKSLRYLRSEYSDKEFVLLIGGDNYEKFSYWKNAPEILDNHQVWAFPRLGKHQKLQDIEVKLFKAPFFEISSSMIRAEIRKGKDMRHFLPNGVYDYIKDNQLY